MEFPKELRYTKDHEWIKVNGNDGIIGITAHAANELGDVVFVDIAEDITEITAEETFGTIEAVKTVSDLLAPISGKVIEINKALNDNPEVINNDPYNEGWMIKIEITDPAQLDALMDADAYAEFIGA